MKQDEMPLGFSMALAQNPAAMEKFTGLSEEKKRAILAGTHSIQSKNEMRQYVDQILSQE